MVDKLDKWQAEGSYFRFNDLKIFYIKKGSGPVLLLIHGYPYNGFDYHLLVEDLALRFTVIIPDMPGMGFSSKPSNHHYCFPEMADMFSSLLVHHSVSEVHIMAHDLGNSVVQELIARATEGSNFFKIKSVAFLNGGLFTDVYRPRLIQILLSKSPKPFGKMLSKIMTKKIVAKATAEVFGNRTKPSAALLEAWWMILNHNKGKALAYLLGRLVFEKDVHQQRWIEAMQRTSIPMCFINGPADPNSGIHMVNRYKELIPNPKTFLLGNDIGHWPQLEAPNDVLHAYFDFVGSEIISGNA